MLAFTMMMIGLIITNNAIDSALPPNTYTF